MNVATGTGVGEDIGNGNAAIGLNDAGFPPMTTVGGDEMMMNDKEGRSPLFSNEEDEGLNIKTHRTRSSIRYKEGDSPLNTNNAALNNDNAALGAPPVHAFALSNQPPGCFINWHILEIFG
jgi:hypothetical protein